MIVLFSRRTLDHVAAGWVARHCLDHKAEMVCTTPRPMRLLEEVRNQPTLSACAELSRREMIQVTDSAASLLAIETQPSLCEELKGFMPSCGELKLAPDKSAAAEVWRHFRAREPEPWLVTYADPRCDLPSAPQIQAALMSFDTDWERWDEVWPLPASDLLRIGDAVLRTLVDLQSQAAATAYDAALLGFLVPVMNYLPGQGVQVLRTLCMGRAFAAAWTQLGPGRYVYELVSDAGEDVGAIARRFKGNGDRHRASFETTRIIHI